jgi:hypothetical protein
MRRLILAPLLALSLSACGEADLSEPTEACETEFSRAGALGSQAGGAWVFNRGGGQPGPSAAECHYWSEGVRFTTHDMTVVHTPSGNVIAKCHFSGLPRTQSDKAETSKGWMCYWWIGGLLHSTRDSKWTRSPGGQATVTCRLTTQFPPP